MPGISGYYSRPKMKYIYERVANGSGASGTHIESREVNENYTVISNTSEASGASGFTVEQLTTNEVTELFIKGNLTVGEMQKWLEAKGATFTFSETNTTVSYNFTLNGKNYEIRCTKDAVESQTDNITQNTSWTKSAIKSILKPIEITAYILEKYFTVVKKTDSGYTTYMINPDSGYQNIKEIKAAIKAEAENNITTLEEFITKLESDEFDKDVTEDEAVKVINQFVDFMKVALKEKYNFSNDFLDMVVEFAIFELNLNQNENYNLKNLLKSIKKDIESITGKAEYYNTIYYGDLYSQNGLKLFLTGTSDTYKDVIISYSQSYFGLQDDDPINKQNHFLHYVFENIYQKLNLSIPEEQTYFFYLVVQKISERLNISAEMLTPEIIMTGLYSNGNGSWIDEIYDIANQLLHELYIPNYQLATNINTDILFANNDNIDAKYISENLINLKFSQDAGVRKFADIINSALSTFNVTNYYDELELINALINIVNNEYGDNSTKSLKLEKSLIEKLNKNTIFEKLEIIINSNEFFNEYYFGSIDGEIGDYRQGNTGDCWLLAGLNAFNNSPTGRMLLNNAIKDNQDGTYSVTLFGVGKTYTFSQEDIIYAIESPAYSHGDRDALLFELAVEELHKDIRNGDVIILDDVLGNITNSCLDINKSLAGNGDAIDSGYGHWFAYYLTGNIGDVIRVNNKDINTVYATLESLAEDLKNDNICITLGANIDNSGHAYTIVDITISELSTPNNNTLTIINPQHSDIKKTWPWNRLELIDRISIYSFSAKLRTFTPEDILKYTTDEEIINKFFYVSVINSNREPLAYRLRDGVTFEDFLAEAGAITD